VGLFAGAEPPSDRDAQLLKLGALCRSEEAREVRDEKVHGRWEERRAENVRFEVP